MNTYSSSYPSWTTTPSWVTTPVTQEAYKANEFDKVLEKAMEGYRSKITEQVFKESPIMEALKKESKAGMDDAVRKAIEKRKEARAELVLAFLDRNWGEPEFGETHTWSAVFSDTPHKEYHYAAIFCDNSRWYVTNYVGNFTHEELKAFIADVCIRAEVYFNGELVA